MKENPPNKTSRPFRSLGALQAEHTQLLDSYGTNQLKVTDELKMSIYGFIDRAMATGSLLGVYEDRADAQTYLNYWTTVLYDIGESLNTPILDRFDKKLAIKKTGNLSPYRGLRAFNKENQNDFFGRRKLNTEMRELVRKGRFLAVVGLSGSGKSSVVRAGLIPDLESGAIAGSEEWLYIDPLLPGRDPLQSLADFVTWSLNVNEGITKAMFLEDPTCLSNACDLTGNTVVVVVDQFEELFTFPSSDGEKEAFVQNLVSVITGPESRHVLILTMRSEFDPYIARYQDLQNLFENAQVRVSSLSAADLRKAIQAPAEQRGVIFEPGLVDELAQRVQGEPAGLPLLQFTLHVLWNNRDGNTITWETYGHWGGSPKDILSTVANKTYDDIRLVEDQELSRRIFSRLVRPKLGPEEVTSNRERRVTLHALGAQTRVDSVLKIWEDAGLLKVTSALEGQISEDDQIEVTHEALIRNWKKLIDWIEDDRSKLHKRLLLAAAAEHWSQYRNDPKAGGLLSGVLLAEAMEYDDLTELENEFVTASSVAEEELELYKRHLVEYEEEVRKSRNRRAVIFLGISTILLTVAAIATVWAFVQRRDLDEAVRNSEKSINQATEAHNLAENANNTLKQVQANTANFEKEQELRAEKTTMEIEEKGREIEEKRREIEGKEREIKALAKISDDAKIKVAQAQKDVAAAQKISKEATETATIKLNELNSDIRRLVADKADLELQKGRLEAERARLAVEKKGLELEKELLRAENEQLQDEQKRLRKDVADLRTVNKENENKLEELINPGIPIPQNGQFQTDSVKWKDVLEKRRETIKKNSAGVGKFEAGNSRGTAFLVADGVLVVPIFMISSLMSTTNSLKDSFIDFREETDNDKSSKFAVTKIIARDEMHQIALLQVEKVNGRGVKLPAALSLVDEISLPAKSNVYLIGYPMAEPKISPTLRDLIFPGTLGVKRLQPGILLSSIGKETFAYRIANLTREVKFAEGKSITHNCLTTGGSAGSPLIDLISGKVIGTHISARPSDIPNEFVKEALPLNISMINNLLSSRR